jgi:hypothetical protein
MEQIGGTIPVARNHSKKVRHCCMLNKTLLYLMWIGRIDPRLTRGNPFAPSTSFLNGKTNG